MIKYILNVKTNTNLKAGFQTQEFDRLKIESH